VNDKKLAVGIDLGTTNSEVAAFVDGGVRVLGTGEAKMLPSAVGLGPSGELLVGNAARNQQLLYPDRTIRSIKRKMGTRDKVRLGERELTPPEVSAILLRTLAEHASRELGESAERAVITVPAYFSDTQRQATREAGALAGLEVLRILNEPTAASLAYGYGESDSRTILLYDLGGGTFDVSIVHMEGDVTEVLASHGNNRLGGDDFDQLLVDRLNEELSREHGIDICQSEPVACSRLFRAAEEAKKELSFEPYARIREESLVVRKGTPIHLEREISRQEYEELIRPLVESTLESVSSAMSDADKTTADLDAVVLVGGSTRIPLISTILEERTGIVPRQEVHPDLCVALGAGVLASRLAGEDVARVLVDVSPYSFGPSHLGEKDGFPYPHCYRPVLHRNTPLPVTRTESYFTSESYQSAVDIFVYQGEDPDAMNNIPLGHFTVEGLTETEEPNEVLCRMRLDVEGILEVSAIEKNTGKRKHITITGALAARSDDEIDAARQRLEALWAHGEDARHDLFTSGPAGEAEFSSLAPAGVRVSREDAEGSWARATDEACRHVERSRKLLKSMHDEDKEEAIDLNEEIERAIAERDHEALARAASELKELLFFVEGR